MPKAKATPASTDLSIWKEEKKLAEIKKIYGKTLSDGEWNTLQAIGLATDLNPFLREIWAVKYGNNAASIFIGRDGYRKVAQRHPNYDYHIVDAVYSGDDFKVVNGEVQHSYSLKDRGSIVGAYCVVARKGSTKPSFSYVELKEYDTKKSVWASKPATMIKKVAEAQGLRMTFQELFAGTYDESEQWDDKEAIPKMASTPKLKEVDPETGEVKDDAIEQVLCATRSQEKKFNELMDRYGLLMSWTPNKTEEMKQGTLKGLGKVEKFEELSEVKAGKLLGVIEEKIKEKEPVGETEVTDKVTPEDVAEVFESVVEEIN